MERRNNSHAVTIETRDDSNVLTGYAAVYYRAGDANTEFEIQPGFVERIRPGAFDSAIERDDVRALFDHDSGRVLGRNKSGTLRLTSDNVGLRYEIDLPNTSDGNAIRELVGRGDVDGSSFSFSVESQQVERDGSNDIRWIEDVRLFDVGPVTYPAYAGTSVDARDAVTAREQFNRKQLETKKKRAAAQTRTISIEGAD